MTSAAKKRSRRWLADLAASSPREQLEALARSYHHLQNEHTRASPGSGVRRRIEHRLLDVRERFDRLLEEWVPNEDAREAWREHLHNHTAPPDEPTPIEPLLFRGRSEAGSTVEVRERAGEELTIEIDGSLVERVAAEKDLAVSDPGLRFRVDQLVFEETFDVSEDALEALADFLENDESPPWEHAPALLSDGVVDTHFALTPRGRRVLGRLR